MTTLEPRPPRPAPPVRSRRRRALSLAVIVAVAAAVTWLIAGLLGDAALFFYNADEAVERRDELGSERFRVQGTPVAGTIAETFLDDAPALAFTVGFEGALIDVVHTGDPRELFQPGVPVVLEGAWRLGPAPVDEPARADLAARDGWYFASDRMLVKHDNDYRNRDDYEDRVDEAEQGGDAAPEPARSYDAASGLAEPALPPDAAPAPARFPDAARPSAARPNAAARPLAFRLPASGAAT